MISSVLVNLSIVVMAVLGFVSTTYGRHLSELPDRIDNPVLAIGFGLAALLAMISVLGLATALFTALLVNVLLFLNLW